MLELPPAPSAGGDDNGDGTGSDAPTIYGYEHLGGDILESIKEERVGYRGMKIDRMLFDRFADTEPWLPTPSFPYRTTSRFLMSTGSSFLST